MSYKIVEHSREMAELTSEISRLQKEIKAFEARLKKEAKENKKALAEVAKQNKARAKAEKEASHESWDKMLTDAGLDTPEYFLAQNYCSK